MEADPARPQKQAQPLTGRTITPMSEFLFSPHRIGALELPNRIVMAPMTRMRAAQPGDVPSALNAAYYAQRATAGLIISEATQISPQGKGYGCTPGIHSPEQIAGWRRVTDAVHAHGGRMVLQLWHVGRVSDPRFQPNGAAPVGPSAILPLRTYVYDVRADGSLEKIPVGKPRALAANELPGIVEDFRRGAANAMAAGFDAVEIHAANGYLLDTFLRAATNHRTDAYGGSLEHRQRLTLEVAAAVIAEVGAERTGMRISPFITFKDIDVTHAETEFVDLASKLHRLGLGYLHLSEVDWEAAHDTPESFRIALRGAFPRTIICAGLYDETKARRVLQKGHADLIAFGRRFIANPDLVRRLREGITLADFDPDALFGGSAKGYSDFPNAT
jgi:N-ethylmaleimide reductase